MRPKVGTVTFLFRLALAAAVVVCGYRLLPTHAAFDVHGVAWNLWSHAAATYGLTILSFAAYPRARRGDIVKLMVVVAGLTEVGRHFAGCEVDRLDAVADATGVVMVFAPSYLDRVRSACRRGAREPFTLAYSGERRGVAARRGGVTTRLAQVGAYAPDEA